MPSRERHRSQSCEGKRRYRNRQEAAETAQHRREETGDTDIHEYPCPFCGGWHIGHTPRPKRTF